MDPLIPEAVMATLKAVDARAMPSTCQVKRREASTSSGGRTTPGVYAAQGAAVPCRLARDTTVPREFEAVGRIGDESVATVAFGITGGVPDVRSGDRIEVTTGASEETFEVIGDPYIGSYSTNLTVNVQREG